jgi:hypothetical protein
VRILTAIPAETRHVWRRGGRELLPLRHRFREMGLPRTGKRAERCLAGSVPLRGGRLAPPRFENVAWQAAPAHAETPETAWPLDVPTLERPAVIRLFFSCSSVVLQLSQSADHRPASVAGSVVARHPAGGSTRRRSIVSLSGGPSLCLPRR